MPMRGRPTWPRSSKTQKLTESRISGLPGRSANMYSLAGSMPPVRSIVMHVSPSLDVVGKQRSNCVQVQPECLRVCLAVGLPLLGVVGPPRVHPRFELVGHRLAQPAVEATNLADRIGLHGAKVDVEEAVFGPAVAKLHHSVHADRPLLHIQLAEIAPVEMVGEAADDIGVD